MREVGPAPPAAPPDLPRPRPPYGPPRRRSRDPRRAPGSAIRSLRPPVPGSRAPGPAGAAAPDSVRSRRGSPHPPGNRRAGAFEPPSGRAAGVRGLRPAAVPAAAAVLALACGPETPAPPAPFPPRLASLEIAGSEGSKHLVPDFDPTIRHYGVRCAERETLTVSAALAEGSADGVSTEAAAVFLNGAPLSADAAEVSLRHDQDLAVEARRGDAATLYAVHCVPLDFPEVTAVTVGPGPAEGLLLVDPWYESEDGEDVGYLAILDDHGVPRYHRRVRERAWNFRRHAAHGLYSYANALEDESCSYREVEIVLLDDRLEVADRVRAAGLCNTDLHDFLITPEGNYLFVSYPPAERDFSALPDREGAYPYSTAEPTHDSVIQEVTPDGEVRFRWNSGEAADGSGPAIKMADCVVDRFPEQYGWLNSFSLTAEGNLLASFRGCAQILEIERPSGRVLRQLGGSAPALPDGRRHLHFVGDPEPAGFCGQHTPVVTGRGVRGDLRLALFDNAIHCLGDEDRPQPHENHPSRVVEYLLSGDEAIFLRHYESLFSIHAAGSVQALANGNWLITWGWGGSRPPTSLVEVDPTGREVLKMRVRGDHRTQIYRAYREPGLTIPLNLP